MTEQNLDPATEGTAPAPPPTAEGATPTQQLTSEEVQAQQNQAQIAERAQTEEAAARGEPPAARTDPNLDAGPGGMSMGVSGFGRPRNEIAGGAIARELAAPPPADPRIDDLYFHRRYINSRLAKEAGHLIARAPENIGFWGKGHTYRGNGGILVNVDTLEKVRVMDGHRFEGDEVYANSRDLPPSLVTGDVAKNLSGEAAQEMAEQRP